MKQRRGPRLVLLLLGVNTFLLALPVAAIAFFRVYDIYLLRQTERQLIAQSVVIGESYRQAWWQQSGIRKDNPRPPGSEDQAYVLVEPLIDLGTEIRPQEEVEDLPNAPTESSPARKAGAKIQPLLRRAQIFNLSGIRVLDENGCVIATTGGNAGKCLSTLAEVQTARTGRYASTARHRISDEPPPPLGDIRRRGKLRVFTALPVYSDGKVIGIVAASRTGLDALSSLWQIRRTAVASVLAVVLFMVVVSFLFARAIARPMRLITERAQAIARGDSEARFNPGGFTPAEIRTLSEALDVMTEKLRARARYISDFAATVSHELKTPIAAVRGAAELLQGWEEMEPAQRSRFVDNILSDAERMDHLVTRLLTLARVENTETSVTAPLDVEASIRVLLQRWGDAVQLEVADPPGQLAIAEEHLAFAVGNLVDNAVRHGGGSPVVLTIGSQQGRLLVTVADHGPGISEANQKRIWDRFFTTERDRGGTGLGLAIVKAIVESRQGRVECSSSAGGTTFRIVL